jgi:hypothetical protein
LKLPFFNPFKKVQTVFQGFEDDKEPQLYKLTMETELPKRMVKAIYDIVLKKKLKVSFEDGLGQGQPIQIPNDFFKQSTGLITWEELLLKQNEKVFIAAEEKYRWFFITKKIVSASIKEDFGTFFFLLEVQGEKKDV